MTLAPYDIADGVARITLDRPDKRNALSRELIRDLATAVATVGGDESVRVVQLTSSGTVFCAGMDLVEMQERAALDEPEASAAWAADAEVYRELVLAILQLPVPTMAVVPGPAIAGGLGLVLACDLVVAADTAWFELPEPKRGLVAAMVAPLLRMRVGRSLATELLLGLRRIDAATTLPGGLCHAVAAPAVLPTVVAEWTKTILAGSRQALVRTKRLLRVIDEREIEEALREAAGESAAQRATSDAREGRAAFLERRAPEWDRE